MASGYSLPPPAHLEIHYPNAAEKWKKFLLAWENYSLATELNKKNEPVQVATLLTVIGEEARDVYSTFNDWESKGRPQENRTNTEETGRLLRTTQEHSFRKISL